MPKFEVTVPVTVTVTDEQDQRTVTRVQFDEWGGFFSEAEEENMYGEERLHACMAGDADHDIHPSNTEGIDECSGCGAEFVREDYLNMEAA